MKVDQKGHTTIIRNTQFETAKFHEMLGHEFNSYKSQNLILDLTHDKSLTIQDIKLFMDMAKNQKKAKKSFIIVASNINFNDIPTKLTVVPTLLEAHDIIEMEEIERDLGF